MTTKMMIDTLRENAREYCYYVYGNDDFMVYEIMRAEMKSLGIINGDDEMIWKSPDKSLYFEVIREDSNSNLPSEGGYRYICTINCKNMLNVPMFSLNFTEIDAVRILYEISYFCSYENWMANEKRYIYINPSNTVMEQYIIELENIKVFDFDNVLFKINKYNPMNKMIANVVTMTLNYDQLVDFCFHIFFALLIDIDLPVQYELQMEDIEDFINSDKYLNWHRQRQNMVNSFTEPIPYQLQREELQPVEVPEPPKKTGKLQVRIRRD